MHDLRRAPSMRLLSLFKTLERFRRQMALVQGLGLFQLPYPFVFG